MKVAIVSINLVGLKSALELLNVMDDFEVTIFGKSKGRNSIETFKTLDEILPKLWNNFEAIIFILATGAVVRKIAPFLQDKSKDPAVLVINLSLNKIIPLIGGHLGGANLLSTTLARRLGAINFITTASEQIGSLAFDILAKERGWRIENLPLLANISNRLIDKKDIKVITVKAIFESIEQKENLKLVSKEKIDINSVVILPFGKFETITLRPKIFIGIGCSKNTTFSEIKEAFLSFQEEFKFLEIDIGGFGSFITKKKESELLEFVDSLGKKINFFDKNSINSLKGDFTTSASERFFGLKGVAEPSAILSSKYKELIIKKRVYFGKITLAGAV